MFAGRTKDPPLPVVAIAGVSMLVAVVPKVTAVGPFQYSVKPPEMLGSGYLGQHLEPMMRLSLNPAHRLG